MRSFTVEKRALRSKAFPLNLCQPIGIRPTIKTNREAMTRVSSPTFAFSFPPLLSLLTVHACTCATRTYTTFENAFAVVESRVTAANRVGILDTRRAWDVVERWQNILGGFIGVARAPASLLYTSSYPLYSWSPSMRT